MPWLLIVCVIYVIAYTIRAAHEIDLIFGQYAILYTYAHTHYVHMYVTFSGLGMRMKMKQNVEKKVGLGI